ncbi:PLP1 [Ecytonucleospora hepatopenaei]|uniref:PLP1 n=1 Tax=Ecytonucleospora hepatopenaei TaxID=646526 RepID=A0A1W0E645_9MICR|nr:PLP1 [Ecytonucleospora hepatopenaei]
MSYFIGEKEEKENFCINEDSDEFIKKYTMSLFMKNKDVYEYANEKEMMDECQKNDTRLFIHFYSEKFEKCLLLNNILNEIVRDIEEAKFLTSEQLEFIRKIKFRRINVKNCMKTVETLNISVLPYIGTFREGYFIEGFQGFEKFGNKEEISTIDVIKYLEASELAKEDF